MSKSRHMIIDPKFDLKGLHLGVKLPDDRSKKYCGGCGQELPGNAAKLKIHC